VKKVILFLIFLLIRLSFSQVPSNETSFLDKIDLIVEPQYEFLLAHWDHIVLDGKPYIQKPVSAHFNFNLEHILGIGIGLRGYGGEIVFTYKLNYLSNSPTASFKLKNNKIIGKILQSELVNEDLHLQYFLNKNVGFGLIYKLNSEEYIPSLVNNYPSLLNIHLGYKMLYLYFPFKFRKDKVRFSGKVGYSIFSKNGYMEYFASFLNFQDPDFPDIPSTAGNATIKINNRPNSIFVNMGVIIYSRLKLLYQFKYDWCESFYKKYENGLIIQFAIPSFE